MSHNITVECGTSVRLPTKGKYCDRDIVVTSKGGSEDLDSVLTEQEALINELKATLKGKASGGGSGGVDIQLLIDRTITEVSSASAAIGDYVFYGCTKLQNIDLPMATSIGSEAFYNCVNLESVELPNVASIGGSAFRRCSVLPSIDLPSVTSIGSNAFRDCKNLQSLIIRSETVCTLGTNTFTSTPIASGTGYIYVPKTLADGSDGVATYQAATNWSAYAAQIRAIEDYPEIIGG